mmetsp:Transcript_27225/g.66082  ORF Transcript_27225/g.66082 Transcript_27225/m.66082 type:complete len:206 (+) Transcript_27225:1045-1662(+)
MTPVWMSAEGLCARSGISQQRKKMRPMLQNVQPPRLNLKLQQNHRRHQDQAPKLALEMLNQISRLRLDPLHQSKMVPLAADQDPQGLDPCRDRAADHTIPVHAADRMARVLAAGHIHVADHIPGLAVDHIPVLAADHIPDLAVDRIRVLAADHILVRAADHIPVRQAVQGQEVKPRSRRHLQHLQHLLRHQLRHQHLLPSQHRRR